MKTFRLFLLFLGLSPLIAVAGHPSIQWSYPLGQPLAAPPQVFADGTGGAVVITFVTSSANPSDTDSIISWLDDDGTEFYRKVFHQNDSSFYIVAVTRDHVVVAIQADQHILVVDRRGAETVIPNASGNGAMPMSWGDEKGFFVVRDGSQATSALVRYRFR